MDINYIEKIREILKITGWSQVRLAEELEITFAALNRWINRHATPRENSLAKLEKIYRTKVGVLPLSEEIIKKSLMSVEKERGRYHQTLNLIQDRKDLREELLLELTYNSNAIEGSTLTRKETEGVIFDHANLSNHSYIEHLEATNHAAALTAIFNGKFSGEVTEAKIKELHRIIMQGISLDGGAYACYQRAIRGVDLRLPDPENIAEEMGYFIKKINLPTDHLVRHVARMHADFEAIHPFSDGNGRVGRLIVIMQLLEAGYAPAIVENNRKALYYEVLEYAQKGSDTHLTRFMAQSVLKGYQVIKKYHG